MSSLLILYICAYVKYLNQFSIFVHSFTKCNKNAQWCKFLEILEYYLHLSFHNNKIVRCFFSGKHIHIISYTKQLGTYVMWCKDLIYTTLNLHILVMCT